MLCSVALVLGIRAQAQDPTGPATFGKGSVSAGTAVQPYPPLLSETPTAPKSLPRRVRPADATSGGIVYTCDATITAVSETACNTLNSTIAALYSSAFTNANASIYVKLGAVGLGQSDWVFAYVNYSDFRNALIASEADANDTTAVTDSVPAVNPYGSGLVGVATALQRALGLASPTSGLDADSQSCNQLGTAGCYDGIITISNTEPLYFRTGSISSYQYDFFTVVEHETDEILGTASSCCGSSGLVFPADYFRYHSNGTRSFAYGANVSCSSGNSTNACFSIDGINMLQQYNNLNNSNDTGDWLSNCARPLVQDYAICSGTAGVNISPTAEILVLDVAGYTLRTPAGSGNYVPGDFNGDGQPDLMWQLNSTGQAAVWYLGGAQGNTYQSWAWLNGGDLPGWSLVGAADFNGDGHPDLIWQNDSTRQIAVWYMGGAQGNTYQSWAWLNGNGLPGWTLVSAADLNDDGHPDSSGRTTALGKSLSGTWAVPKATCINPGLGSPPAI